MKGIEYRGIESVEGPVVAVRRTENVSYNEVVYIRDKTGQKKTGRVIDLNQDACIVQVFGSTTGIDLKESSVEFLGEPLELRVGEGLLGRIFNGLGQPIDGYGQIVSSEKLDVNGSPINPFARVYPRDFIQTGISAIDGMNTLIRGQKLPIFSGNGLPHNKLAAQIIRQAKLKNSDDQFVMVFAGMGIKYDVARFFVNTFEESGVLSKVVMFQSLADAPSIERIITPRCALTAAEYLAYKKGMHVLVVMTDMTNYCEALREISTTRGEVPGRKGYPGYLYSDLAELYERAGRIKGSEGSITQIPILTMPN
ncbi:MAG: V-type ATP synthase subunit B, partial [Treponema sp.]|nr:V-type ATP synthase subunit B [Treponema sp.]